MTKCNTFDRVCFMRFLPIPILKWLFYHRLDVSINSLGIEFIYYVDEVIWVWPWKRTKKHLKYISILSESEFASLAEIKQFWIMYEEHEKRYYQEKL